MCAPPQVAPIILYQAKRDSQFLPPSSCCQQAPPYLKPILSPCLSACLPASLPGYPPSLCTLCPNPLPLLACMPACQACYPPSLCTLPKPTQSFCLSPFLRPPPRSFPPSPPCLPNQAPLNPIFLPCLPPTSSSSLPCPRHLPPAPSCCPAKFCAAAPAPIAAPFPSPEPAQQHPADSPPFHPADSPPSTFCQCIHPWHPVLGTLRTRDLRATHNTQTQRSRRLQSMPSLCQCSLCPPFLCPRFIQDE